MWEGAVEDLCDADYPAVWQCRDIREVFQRLLSEAHSSNSTKKVIELNDSFINLL